MELWRGEWARLKKHVTGGCDKEHIGKMIMYLSLMLVAVTTRVRAMGVLTDGRHAALYVANKSPDGTITFARSSSLALNQGEQVASNVHCGAFRLRC